MFAAGLDASGCAAGGLEIGGMLAGSGTLLTWGRWIGAPGAVISAGVISVRIGANLYNDYVDKEKVGPGSQSTPARACSAPPRRQAGP
jgi:hypothetical protein